MGRGVCEIGVADLTEHVFVFLGEDKLRIRGGIQEFDAQSGMEQYLL
jgi:hypothetical protein